MGIASHFGVLSGAPAIGCAKNMLFGKYNPLALDKFSNSAIYDGKEIIGYASIKKDIPDNSKFKKLFWFSTIALLIMLLTIPWPFREMIGRPLFPGMH